MGAILGIAIVILGLFLPLPARAAPGDVSFSLTDLSPAIARPGDTLTITGTLTNSGSEAFTDPEVRIGVQRSVPRDAATMLSWFDQENPPSARLEYRGTHTVSIAPGQSETITLSIPLDQIPFPIRFDNWGARGLEITLASGETIASVRTMGIFYPEEDPDEGPLQVAAAIPATPTATEWEAALETGQLAGAEAANRVRYLTAIPGATIGLDPVMVDASAALEVIGLPWADADAGMLTTAGREGNELLDQAAERARDAFGRSAVAATDDIAWPLADGISSEALSTLAGRGWDGVVLTSQALSPSEELRESRVDIFTSSTEDQNSERGDAEDTEGVMPAVVGDATFTAILLGEVPMANVSEVLAARQLTIATTAVAVRQDSDLDTLAAVIDREAAAAMSSEDAAAIGERLTALGQAPWVDLTDVMSMLEEPPAQTAHLDEAGSSSFPAANLVVAETLRLDVTLAGLASAFPTIEGELTQMRETLTLAPSSAWRVADSTGAVISSRVATRVEELQNAVAVAPPESNVNLFAEESAIPVVVTNQLEVPVTVHITLTPEEPALRIEGVPNVVIEPQSTQTVRVPVTALANMTTDVVVTVTSPSGVLLGPPATFQMSVQAEWESVTTGVLAAALGVLLVIGLIRNIRRGRRGDDGMPPAQVERVKEGVS